MRGSRSLVLVLAVMAGAARAADAPTPPLVTSSTSADPSLRVLRLAEALAAADANNPDVHEAMAAADAARARVRGAFASWLPQVNVSASAGVGVATTSFPPGSGATVGGAQVIGGALSWTADVSARQLIYDFGQTTSRVDAARESGEGQQETLHASTRQVHYAVQAAYYSAAAAQGLVGVAREAIVNQQRRLEQAQGFFEVGTKPSIDVVEARALLARAQVDLIDAENTYATAKLQLAQIMGRPDVADYALADEAAAIVDGEDGAREKLVDEAIDARPEVKALMHALEASKASLAATRGAYGPSIAAVLDAGHSGYSPLRFDAGARVTLSWPLFEGFRTNAAVDEAEANVAAQQAVLTARRNQVFVEVEQARLALRAGKASLTALEEDVMQARERLKLAEGRYSSGVGTALELSDAQVEWTRASAQRVQAIEQLSAARAQLSLAVGR